jgi:DNA-binding NarL/FixJ family response regulator
VQYPLNILVTVITKGIMNTEATHNNDIRLTPRQQQVLKLVCHRGLPNKSIAAILKISESTVKIHISAILKKYAVKNRTQLVLAFNNELRP